VCCASGKSSIIMQPAPLLCSMQLTCHALLDALFSQGPEPQSLAYSGRALQNQWQEQRHAEIHLDSEPTPAAARLRSIASNITGPVHVSTSRNTVPAATQSVALPPPPFLIRATPPPLLSLLLALPPLLQPVLPLPPLLLSLVSLGAPLTCHLRSMEYSSGAVTQRSCISGVSTCGKQRLL
jgi:hypothetical protein